MQQSHTTDPHLKLQRLKIGIQSSAVYWNLTHNDRSFAFISRLAAKTRNEADMVARTARAVGDEVQQNADEVKSSHHVLKRAIVVRLLAKHLAF